MSIPLIVHISCLLWQIGSSLGAWSVSNSIVPHLFNIFISKYLLQGTERILNKREFCSEYCSKQKRIVSPISNKRSTVLPGLTLILPNVWTCICIDHLFSLNKVFTWLISLIHNSYYVLWSCWKYWISKYCAFLLGEKQMSLWSQHSQSLNNPVVCDSVYTHLI